MATYLNLHTPQKYMWGQKKKKTQMTEGYIERDIIYIVFKSITHTHTHTHTQTQ